MNKTIEILKAIEKSKLTFADFKSSLNTTPLEFKESKSWIALFLHLLNIAFCSVAINALLVNFYWWKILILLPISYLIALSYTGFFVLVHDCGHYSFSRIRILNDIVGVILSSAFFINFYSWVVGHNHHHSFSNIKAFDTNWTEKMLTADEYNQLSFSKKIEYKLSYGSIFGLLIANIYAMTRYFFIPFSYPQTKNSVSRKVLAKIWFANLCLFSLTGLIVFSLIKFGGMKLFFFVYLLPYMISSFFGSLFTYLHHVNEGSLVYDKKHNTNLRSQIVSTFDIRFPKHIEFFCHYINVHLVHHINPKIPWYNLEQATENFKSKYPEYYQTQEFSWELLKKCWQSYKLQYDENIHAYKMVN